MTYRRATRLPGSSFEYCFCRRGRRSRIYAASPSFSFGISLNFCWVSAIVSSEASSIALPMSLNVSLLKGVCFSGRNCFRGSKPKKASISFVGFHPAKTSNLLNAMAISGLWFVSVNFSGSFLCSFAASSLSG